jgi:hypothetical protein
LYPLHLRKERSYEFVYLLFHFSSSLTFLIICNGGSWVGSVDQVANKELAGSHLRRPLRSSKEPWGQTPASPPSLWRAQQIDELDRAGVT